MPIVCIKLGFLVSCEWDDRTLYKVSAFMLSVQNRKQPPQTLFLEYLYYPLRIGKQSLRFTSINQDEYYERPEEILLHSTYNVVASTEGVHPRHSVAVSILMRISVKEQEGRWYLMQLVPNKIVD